MLTYTSLSQQQYVDLLVNLISTFEGQIPTVRNTGDGQRTIGYGYTFGRNNNLALWQAAGIALTPAEIAVLQRIDAAPTLQQRNTIAEQQFTRAISKPEAIALLRQTYPEYEGPANQLGMPPSLERAAFVSLSYNLGVPGLEQKMPGFYKAIRTQPQNRAEAWYEIRYGFRSNSPGWSYILQGYLPSNPNEQFDRGLAKRRFEEAAVFGLYENPTGGVAREEAEQIYRMFQAHRQEILDYENAYGQLPIANMAVSHGRSKRGDMVSAARTDYASLVGFQPPNYLLNTLEPAKNVLLAYVFNQYSSALGDLNTNDYLSTAIFLGNANTTNNLNAVITDSEGAEITAKDVLIGGDEADHLRGGKGDDVLIGGKGVDVYEFASGDGNDRIVETRDLDGKIHGLIVINDELRGELVASGVFGAVEGQANTWRSLDGNITLTHNSPWTLVTDDGVEIDLGMDFQEGDFGIHLVEAPTDPETTLTILGDIYRSDTVFDAQGNGLAADPIIPVPNREDHLHGSTGNDLIQSGGGNDAIESDDGDDVIDAGAGDDVAGSDHGNDVVTGGTGRDVLWGGAGDDRVYAEAEQDLEAAIAQGETDTATGSQGEFLDGAAGQDLVVGSAGNDAILGGGGVDVLVGGAGDDLILADLHMTFVDQSWSVARWVEGTEYHYQFTNAVVGPDGGAPDSDPADDTVYGGAGNDWIFGDAGADLLDGGTGDDALFGEDGDDILVGGADADVLVGGAGDDFLGGDAGADTLVGDGGDDTLLGGENDDQLVGGAGDDYLDAGDGTNVLVGGAGHDVLYAGTGNDQLFGDASDVLEADQGDDYLDGGAGDDYLRGYGGNDTLFGGDGADTLLGDAGDDVLDGEAGDDTFWGGTGADALYGGDGADELYGEAGDDYLDGGAGVNILVGGAGSDVLYGGDDADRLDADGTDVEGDDFVDGGGGNDTIWGHGGADVLYGGDGSDVISAGDGDDYVEGGAGDDTLWGDAGADVLFGDAGADTLSGNAGNDYLDGGTGADTLWGDAGDDLFIVDDVNDVVVEYTGEGTDIIESTVSYTLPTNVENLVLTGLAAGNLTGNAQDNVLTGTVGDNILNGGGGTDTLIGDAGNDLYGFNTGYGQDVIQESGPVTDENGIVLGPGIAPGQVTIAQDGDDVLLSVNGTGDQLRVADWFTDRRGLVDGVLFYYDMTQLSLRQVFNAAPTVATTISDQPATEDSPFQFTVPAETFTDDAWDAVTLWATRADDSPLPSWLTFDPQTNTFTGTPTNGDVGTLSVKVTATDAYGAQVSDTFDLTIANTNDAPVVSIPIADQMAQEGAAFQFVVPANTFTDVDLGDTLTYAATRADGSALPAWLTFALQTRTFAGTPPAGSAGTPVAVRVTATDGAQANVSDDFTLEIAGVFTGTAGPDTLVGTTGPDILYGLAGADRLDGGAGNDAMYGGPDNDTYVVGQAGDTVIENPNDGTDTVEAAVSYTLPANVEHLMIRGKPTQIGIYQANTGTWYLDSNGNVGYDGGGVDATTQYGGEPSDNPMVGDWNGDGVTQVGIYRASIGWWYVDSNGNLLYDAGGVDTSANFGGDPSDIPIVGDWNGDGATQIGVYRASTGTWYLDANGNFAYDGGGDAASVFGADPSDIPIVGDWNGDGATEIGIYRASTSTWYLDANGNLAYDGGGGDTTAAFGADPADIPIVGDWNGDGATDIGIYRPGDLTWYLDANGNGAWDGAGIDTTASFGADPADIPIVGDWNGDGATDIGVYRASTGTWYLDANGNFRDDGVGVDLAGTFGGLPADIPLVGTWRIPAVDGTGNSLNNTLTGNAGPNRLDGGAGADTMAGGFGDDTYVVDDMGDAVTENPNQGTDTVETAITYTLGANLENLTLTGASAINGTGNDVANVLTGNVGANRLDGGLGADTLAGGNGDDTYVVAHAGVVVTEGSNQGTDTVESGVNYTLPENVENLTFTGTADLTGTGNVGSNTIYGNAGNNRLDGAGGYDNIYGGPGNDTYVRNAGDGGYYWETAGGGVDTVESTVSVNLPSTDVEILILTGTDAIDGGGNLIDNTLIGNSAANVLSGSDGNDRLDGGGATTGVDILYGGRGNDTYVVHDANVVIQEQYPSGPPADGYDTVEASVSFTLPTSVEVLRLTGSSDLAGKASDWGGFLYGNAGNNLLTGGTWGDTLDGGPGADTLVGLAEDDVYYVDNPGDLVVENANEGTETVHASVDYTMTDNVERLYLVGSGNIGGTGNALDNQLWGNTGNNVLRGGAGNDAMGGAEGNDTYGVDSVGDVLYEDYGKGTDTVESTISYTLGSNFENLTLLGTNPINGTGNSGPNVLRGNSAANTLTGGAGNDTYYVSTGDAISDSAGTDTVYADITYTLGSSLEHLTLTGANAINGTGNTLANVLTGNSAANTLTGGAGNDSYYVSTGDTVTEGSSQGTDTVYADVAWSLGANLERLTLLGSGNLNGTGNTLANTLTGNAGNNTLDGGSGNDTMVGGAGDDMYVRAETGDVVTENANEGADTVQSSITHTLAANVENLTLTGSSNLNGTGNTLNNVLTGNSGTNTLTGLAGDDTYVIGTGDTVVEASGGGTDTVQSSITYTLGPDVEHLTLTGSSALNGTGNTLNNILTGNSGTNTLTGLAGNDTLSGGQGADTLAGGTGNDIYQFARGDGQDTIQENDATVGNSDTVLFGATINPLDLVLSQQGNDLRLTLHGTTDQVTIQGWYTGTAAQTEILHAGNGQELLNTQVDQLIQAMAAFSVQTGLTWDQGIDQRPQDVQNILAASWV